MSWSTRTWEPKMRRDGPLLAVAAFFITPAAFFLFIWYAQYFGGLAATPVIGSIGIAALATPPLLCFRLARRAGRRGLLWFILVLSGMLLAHWLPARYLVIGGPLPSGAYAVTPDLLRQTLAATLVSLMPLIMGMVPIVVYGLALGLDRPLPGTPPRGAVVLTAAGGASLWAIALFASLLNPIPPIFAIVEQQADVVVNVSRPPAISAELEETTWKRLFWRLHDGAFPGASGVDSGEEGVQLQLPASLVLSPLLDVLMGPGVVEFVDAGDAPPAAGTEVSTSLRTLAAAEFAFETVLTGDDLIQEGHWSGVSYRMVDLVTEGDNPILMVHLNEDGLEKLRRYAEENQGDFLALVIDNVVVLSFPVRSSIDSHVLSIRRLDPSLAAPIAAIIRYGPLLLSATVEIENRPAP